MLLSSVAPADKAYGTVSITLFDLSGKSLGTTPYTPENRIIRIDFSLRPQGVYYIRVRNPISGKSPIRKIVK